MLRNKIKTTILILTVAMAITSCNRKTVYDHYNHTPINGWERNDTLTFCIKPLAEAGDYKEDIGLRINGAYPFMGLCLIVEQTILPAKITRCDTLNCKLVSEDGTVKGRGVSYYQYNFHLTTINLNKGDSLNICIRHNMKREILPGIADVGIKLDKN